MKIFIKFLIVAVGLLLAACEPVPTGPVDVTARITQINGEVLVNGAPARRDQVLNPGVRLDTRNGGSARVQFFEGSRSSTYLVVHSHGVMTWPTSLDPNRGGQITVTEADGVWATVTRGLRVFVENLTSVFSGTTHSRAVFDMRRDGSVNAYLLDGTMQIHRPVPTSLRPGQAAIIDRFGRQSVRLIPPNERARLDAFFTVDQRADLGGALLEGILRAMLEGGQDDGGAPVPRVQGGNQAVVVNPQAAVMQVRVPNLIGRNLTDATTALKNGSLRLGPVNVLGGQGNTQFVRRQFPAAGSLANAGSSVTVWVEWVFVVQ